MAACVRKGHQLRLCNGIRIGELTKDPRLTNPMCRPLTSGAGNVYRIEDEGEADGEAGYELWGVVRVVRHEGSGGVATSARSNTASIRKVVVIHLDLEGVVRTPPVPFRESSSNKT
jgi:hypothetical protein